MGYVVETKGANALNRGGYLEVISAPDYGVRPNARITYDVVTTSSSTTITSASASFTQADVGKTVAIYDTQSAGNQVVCTTIASVTNATTAVLTNAASESVSSGNGAMVIGTPQDTTQLKTRVAEVSGNFVSGTLHPPTTGGLVYVDFPTTQQGSVYLFNSSTALNFTGNPVLNGFATLAFAYPINIEEREYAVQLPAYGSIDTLDIRLFGSGSGVLLGENSKQSHSFINNLTVWFGARDVDAAEIPPYLAGLEIRGNNYSIGKIYIRDCSAGIYGKNVSDITFAQKAHIVGCAYGVILDNVNNIHGGHICDSLEEKGMVIENGADNIKWDIDAFTANEEFDSTDYVLDIAPTTTTVSNNLDISIIAQRVGGKVLRLAYVKDSRFRLVATNESGDFTPHANGVITQMVEYGSGNGGAIDIHCTRDGAITTLFSGTRVGNLFSVSDGVASMHGATGGIVGSAQTTGTQVSISNSVVETTLSTFTISGNSMGASSTARLRVHGTYTNNTGGTTNVGFTFKIVWGGTTVYQDVIANAAATGATARPWVLDFNITNAGSTNLQRMNGTFIMGTSTANTAGIGDLSTGGGIVGALGYGTTTAIDTTASATLAVTATMAQASTNLSMTCDGSFLDVLRTAVS